MHINIKAFPTFSSRYLLYNRPMKICHYPSEDDPAINQMYRMKFEADDFDNATRSRWQSGRQVVEIFRYHFVIYKMPRRIGNLEKNSFSRGANKLASHRPDEFERRSARANCETSTFTATSSKQT